MTPEIYDQAKRIIEQSEELPEAIRNEHIERLCAGKPELLSYIRHGINHVRSRLRRNHRRDATFGWTDKNGPAPNIQPRFVSVDIVGSIAVVRLFVLKLMTGRAHLQVLGSATLPLPSFAKSAKVEFWRTKGEYGRGDFTASERTSGTFRCPFWNR